MIPSILRVGFPSCSTSTRATNLKKNPTYTVKKWTYSVSTAFLNISHFSHNKLVHLGFHCGSRFLVFLHPFKHGAIGTASLGAVLVRVV